MSRRNLAKRTTNPVYTFGRLYQTLDQTTSTNAKVAAMTAYFAEADARDAAWAVYFLSGRRLKRLIGAARLREWLIEQSDLPDWLVEDTYASVGDLAETIALLLAQPGNSLEALSLADWVEERILPLRELDAEEQSPIVTAWWQGQDYEGCYIVNKLLTGALRVGVSKTLLARAVADYADLDRALILHRLMGDWTPDEDFWKTLIADDDGAAVLSRPYPFCLASPLENDPETLGQRNDWLAEWKWDGIRSQLIRREGETYLWSRGEELIGERFPDIVAIAEHFPDGVVVDGEILAWNDGGVMPFAELQRRIGRKTVGKKLLTEVPCALVAYDLLEQDGIDIRERPMAERRELLTRLVASASSVQRPVSTRERIDAAPGAKAGAIELTQGGSDRLHLSAAVDTSDWEALRELRAESRQRHVEGLMLKSLDSSYGTGRKRGSWWKWKIEPHTIDAVMIYAQAGHGRRANLFTDYTFAVWQGDDTLVPFAKAYSGLDNKEIATLDKWIRRHTIERFGPVRSVEPVLVFELAFEGINLSTRHKSGVAVRFPRIARWRHDLTPKDAETLEDVKRLIEIEAAEPPVKPAT